MRIALIATLLSITLALAGAERGTEPPGPSAIPPEDRDPTATPTRMAHEGVKRLKADGVVGLCEIAFAAGKTVNKPEDRALAEAHFTRLRDALTTRYGKSSGEFEFIRKEVAGTSVVKFTYLEKLEKTAVVWKFVFYRVSGEWKWKDIGVTDNLDGEFRPAP